MRLIGDAGEQFGVISTSEALHQANESGLDLVEVNPTGNPPVCKLVDFGKMQYEQEKKERKQKAKQKRIEVKGIRLSVRIAENDMKIRAAQAEKFLNEGDKVQIQLQLRGREKAHPDKAYEVINEFMKLLPPDKTNLEQSIKRQGGRFTCLVSPKK